MSRSKSVPNIGVFQGFQMFSKTGKLTDKFLYIEKKKNNLINQKCKSFVPALLPDVEVSLRLFFQVKIDDETRELRDRKNKRESQRLKNFLKSKKQSKYTSTRAFNDYIDRKGFDEVHAKNSCAPNSDVYKPKYIEKYPYS